MHYLLVLFVLFVFSYSMLNSMLKRPCDDYFMLRLLIKLALIKLLAFC